MTEAGGNLFRIAQRIISLEAEAEDLLNAYGRLQAGHLYVSAVGPYHATERLSTFNERYPGVRLSVTAGNSIELVERILDYSVDAAVLAQVEDDPRIYAMPYSRRPVAVFVNKSHRFAKRRRIRLAEM